MGNNDALQLDSTRLRELFEPLYDESVDLAPRVFAGNTLPDHPCAYIIRDTFHDRKGRLRPPAEWPGSWREHWQLPYPFVGDPLGGPKVAFVGLNPNVDARELCPRIDASLDDWLEAMRTGFDECGRFHMAIEPVPLFELYYQPILRIGLGDNARLGRDAIVTEIVPYRSHSPYGRVVWRPARTLRSAIEHPMCLRLTLRFLLAMRIRIIVTVGNEATQHLGSRFVPELEKARTTQVHAKPFHADDGVSIIPARHKAGFGVSGNDLRRVGEALRLCVERHRRADEARG